MKMILQYLKFILLCGYVFFPSSVLLALFYWNSFSVELLCTNLFHIWLMFGYVNRELDNAICIMSLMCRASRLVDNFLTNFVGNAGFWPMWCKKVHWSQTLQIWPFESKYLLSLIVSFKLVLFCDIFCSLKPKVMQKVYIVCGGID